MNQAQMQNQYTGCPFFAASPQSYGGVPYDYLTYQQAVALNNMRHEYYSKQPPPPKVWAKNENPVGAELEVLENGNPYAH